MAEQSTLQLLAVYVWGNEPENQKERIQTLTARGINLDALTKDVDKLIKKYAGEEED